MPKFTTIHELTSSAAAALAREDIDTQSIYDDLIRRADGLRQIKNNSNALAIAKIVTDALGVARRAEPAQYRFELKRMSMLLACVTLGDL